MGIKINYDDLKNFQKQLEEFNNSNKYIGEIAEELAEILLKHVIDKTPVSTGNLKNGWKISQLKKQGNTYTIEVFNDVEYASSVEYGNRNRQGKFMLTLSENELKRELKGLVEARIQAQLNKIFGR